MGLYPKASQPKANESKSVVLENVLLVWGTKNVTNSRKLSNLTIF